MSAYEIFDIIANSAVGNLGNVALLTLQIYISTFFEIKFLFDSMKHKPALVKISISLIPLVLIGTYTIVSGLIFGSFLDHGPSLQAMNSIVQITLTQQSIDGMMIVVGLFLFLMILYSLVNKLKIYQ